MAQTPYSTQAPVAYSHVVNAGTVVLKSAAGALLGFNINEVTAASTGTIYDASGTAGIAGTVEVGIFSLGTNTVSPQFVSEGPPGIGLKLNNGCVVVTTGTCDLTFAIR
jgi:hypothetical protein